MHDLLTRIQGVLRDVHKTEPIYRPVKIDTIVSAVVSSGAIGRINLIASDMNPDILLAQLIQKTLPDGTTCADIYYSRNTDKATQRVCIAKEIIHIFDTSEEKTTIPQVDRLLDDLCVVGGLVLGNPQMKSEKRALYGAIELLVAYEARMVLIGSLVEARYGMKTLAAAFSVPEEMMKLALSKSYNEEIDKIRASLRMKMIA